MKHTTFALAAFLGLGSVASADTIVFDPLATGVDTLSNNGDTANIDLNQDGYADVQAGIGRFFETGGYLLAINDQFRFVNGDPDPDPQDPFSFSFIAPLQEVAIAATNGLATLFSAGDEVGADDFANTVVFADLFGSGGSATNLLPDVGDTAFFGFRIIMGDGEYQQLDGFLPTGFVGPTETFYGFLEVTHGSVQIGLAGYNNAAGQAAVIPGGTPNQPVVPLPASAVLLLAGLAGLGAMGTQRKA